MILIMVLLLDGNSVHVAQLWRQIGSNRKKSDLWLLSILLNALADPTTEIAPYLRTFLPYSCARKKENGLFGENNTIFDWSRSN